MPSSYLQTMTLDGVQGTHPEKLELRHTRVWHWKGGSPSSALDGGAGKVAAKGSHCGGREASLSSKKETVPSQSHAVW